MWFSHHALVTQQTVSAALRSFALAPLFLDDAAAERSAAADAPQLALILLQGALLLALCTIVHKALSLDSHRNVRLAVAKALHRGEGEGFSMPLLCSSSSRISLAHWGAGPEGVVLCRMARQGCDRNLRSDLEFNPTEVDIQRGLILIISCSTSP